MINHQGLRRSLLIGVHVYIVFHMLAWYVFDWKLWGKTAMVGVLSLAAGRINAAAIMVAVILLSILFYGRFFCGWFCHLRGAIELADWVMRKLGLKGYKRLRDKNVLVNTRYRWSLRGVTLFILLTPVYFFWLAGKFKLDLNPKPLRPMADLPGYDGRLFVESAPVNMDITAFAAGDFLIAFGALLFILFVISFFLNYFYGQGAFCRVLCPYAVLFSGFLNLNPLQKKITRVGECTGCRRCSNNCPQGIDVSRELYHHNGKVTSCECIKCFKCVDGCDSGVLADSRRVATNQKRPRKEYERIPWLDPSESLQVIEPFSATVDVISVIVAVLTGTLASVFGGFWFYVGAIFGFVVYRRGALYVTGREKGDAVRQRV